MHDLLYFFHSCVFSALLRTQNFQVEGKAFRNLLSSFVHADKTRGAVHLWPLSHLRILIVLLCCVCLRKRWTFLSSCHTWRLIKAFHLNYSIILEVRGATKKQNQRNIILWELQKSVVTQEVDNGVRHNRCCAVFFYCLWAFTTLIN